MTSLPAVAAAAGELRSLHAGCPVVLVPTMGGLHAGHLSLIERARELAGTAGKVCVSIFVNPLQFGPEEDFAEYPRNFEADLKALAGLADTVFAPGVEQMYPEKQEIQVSAPQWGSILEGADRPDHFAGVLTAVAKLFSIVQPEAAVFGRKDYQQLVLVRMMCRQLALPVRIADLPVVRAPDGLALSSRNERLDQASRACAREIYPALLEAAKQVAAGESPQQACAAARQRMSAAGLQVSYVACVPEGRLCEIGSPTDKPCVLLAAASAGDVRLIDCVASSEALLQ